MIIKAGRFGPLEKKHGTLELPEGGSIAFSRSRDSIECTLRDESGDPVPDSLSVFFVDERRPVYFIPLLPELPVMLRMDHTLIIAPREKISLSVSLPLIPALAVRGSRGKYQELIRYPLANLSKTWFGEPEAGEPAYSLSFSLDHTEKEDFSWKAACSLTIFNTSPELLHFQRLLLRVSQYSLYWKDDCFQSDEVTVKFRGMDQISQVSVGSQGETGDRGYLFSGPQIKKDTMGLRKSFYFLKSLTSF